MSRPDASSRTPGTSPTGRDRVGTPSRTGGELPSSRRPEGVDRGTARPGQGALNGRADRLSGTPSRTLRGRDTPTRVVPGRTADERRPHLRDRGSSVRPAGDRVVHGRTLYRSNDVRYHRPSRHHVRPLPYTRGVPRVTTYRSYYSRWWCHPFYRYHYATVAVVGFGFTPYAWDPYWAPPVRYGWVWVPGYWSWGFWHPGFWRPSMAAPVGYVYVHGWWENDDTYVEGYYRTEARDDWEWVDGHYLEDGTYVRGHWQPLYDGPEGYLWEPGFWDGETYVDGFWRPQYRQSFLWVSSWYDADGIFHSGYWMPEEEPPGQVWIPGWFDGNEWVEGYFEDEQAYLDTDLDAWEPEAGHDDGWEIGEVIDDGIDDALLADDGPPSARIVELYSEIEGDEPLAVPVVIPDEE